MVQTFDNPVNFGGIFDYSGCEIHDCYCIFTTHFIYVFTQRIILAYLRRAWERSRPNISRFRSFMRTMICMTLSRISTSPTFSGILCLVYCSLETFARECTQICDHYEHLNHCPISRELQHSWKPPFFGHYPFSKFDNFLQVTFLKEGLCFPRLFKTFFASNITGTSLLIYEIVLTQPPSQAKNVEVKAR